MYFLKLKDENPLIIVIALILAMCGSLYVYFFEDAIPYQIIEFGVVILIGVITFWGAYKGAFTWIKRRRADIQVWLVEEPMVVESDVKVEAWVEETSLPPNSLELVYFNIRNTSEIRLKNCRIWIKFPPEFHIIHNLDSELEKRNISTKSKFPLGSLHRTRNPILNKDKIPNYNNMEHNKEFAVRLGCHAFFDPMKYKLTFNVFETDDDSGYFPLWIETPRKEGKYSVQIVVSPENIEKEFRVDLQIIVESAN
ncbi:MAG: hypothetical protein V3T58_00550 [Candidatus Hydrothermarchaeales archaeon]